ncbi:MAG: GHKL domain-containing protein [Bacteroidia bacterium]
MLRTIILYLALGFSASAWANPTIDSLKNSLTHKSDSNDCKTYQRLCFAHLNIDLDKAVEYGLNALTIAKSIDREASIISSKNAVGLAYFYKSDLELARKYWLGALFSVNKFNNTSQEYQLLVRLGIANSNLGFIDSARIFFYKAKQIGVAEQDSSKIITCLSNIAVEEFRQGFHDKAIPLNIEVLKWYKENYQNSYATNISNIANNLSSSFIDFKDWVSAAKYALIGKRYAQRANFNQGIINSFTLFGIIESESGSQDSAQNYYNLALNRLEKSPNDLNQIQLFNNKAQSFIKTKAFDSASTYFSKAYRIGERIKAPLNKCISLLGISQVKLKNKEIDSALINARKGYLIAKKGGYNTDKMNASKLLSTVFSKLGVHDSSYYFLNEYLTLNDSLNSIEAIQKITAIERLNEQKVQKQKLKQAKTESLLNAEKLELKEKQNTYLITFSVIVLVVLGGLLVTFFSLYKTRNRLTGINGQLIREKELLTTKTQELNAANETLKETQAQLIQSEKLASLGQLTAGIAHEINNPINFVKAGIESLKLELEDVKKLITTPSENAASKTNEDDLGEMINEIEAIAQGITNGANRTAEIVKGLRVYARTSDEGKTSFNVKESIENTLLLLKNSYKDRVEITTSFDRKTVIDGYGQKLDQVFMNLISNAIQAIENQGKIEITTLESDEQVKVKITDSGFGISEDQINRIFDPFYTTKEVGEGTGLGLAISMGIVKEHNGSIDVQSEPGKTTFTVTLPLKQ